MRKRGGTGPGSVASGPLLALPLTCSASLGFTGSCVSWLLAKLGQGTLVPGPPKAQLLSLSPPLLKTGSSYLPLLLSE